MTNVEVQSEVAADQAKFGQWPAEGYGVARPELGHSVHVEVAGSSPAVITGIVSASATRSVRSARTRTAPAAGIGHGSATDWRSVAAAAARPGTSAHIAGLQKSNSFRLPQRRLHLRGTRGWRSQPDAIGSIGTRRSTRRRLSQPLRAVQVDPDLMAAHASAPFIVSWDDHEVDNDYAGDLDEQNTPSELFLLRRAAAYQAYYETMPFAVRRFRRSRDALLPPAAVRRLLDLSVLDTRQYRSKQACGGGSKPGCAEAMDPERTMLGGEQEKWLFEEPRRARGARGRCWAAGPDLCARREDIDPATRSRWTSGTEMSPPATVCCPAEGDERAQPVAALRRRASALRRRPEARLHAAGLRDHRHRVHEHSDHVRRRWRRRFRRLGEIEVGQPAHQVHSAGAAISRVPQRPRQMRADFKILDKVTVPNLPARIGGSLVVEAGTARRQTSTL